MTAYLLTWNPDRWEWVDIDDVIARVREGEFVFDRWSTGVTKQITNGDRLYLMRLGQAPKGILASGWANSTVFQDETWNQERTGLANYVEWQIEELLDPASEEILSLEELQNRFPSQHWTPENSGISIREEVAGDLDVLWSHFLARTDLIPAIYRQSAAIDLEVNNVPERVKFESYRVIRDTALSNYVKRLHKYTCQLCGDTIVLSNDKRYAEAHHIRPLGTPHNGPDIEANILCVCPNCHARLDYGAVAIDLREIRQHPVHEIASEYVEYHNSQIFQG